MYRSYSVNNMPEPVMHHKEKPQESINAPQKEVQDKNELQKKHSGGFLDNLKQDDTILLAVIFVLLLDECDDKLLLAALGFIFLSDRL